MAYVEHLRICRLYGKSNSPSPANSGGGTGDPGKKAIIFVAVDDSEADEASVLRGSFNLEKHKNPEVKSRENTIMGGKI